MDRIRHISCSLITAVVLSVFLGCETGPRGQADAGPATEAA